VCACVCVVGGWARPCVRVREQHAPSHTTRALPRHPPAPATTTPRTTHLTNAHARW
jgi:hypothetical protein